MKYELKVYSIWEFGQRKDSQGNPHQEDSLFPEFGKHSANDRLFILCDGMGGHDAGEVASATVCEAMSRSVLNNGRDKDGVFTVDDFNAAINEAFSALDEKDNGAEKKMGTTMTFLKLHNGGAFIAHMGDSRVYHIRPGKDGEGTEIKYVTHDHSLVNDLIKIGELTREEARNSKQKNIITRAMQPNMARRPKADIYQTADIKAGDYFYMCSDGMLEQPEMEDGTSLKNIFSEMGGSDENKVQVLKSVTEKNRDNHTAFIIHITNVLDPIPATAPATESESDKFTAIVEDDLPDETPSNGGETSTTSETFEGKTENAAIRSSNAGKGRQSVKRRSVHKPKHPRLIPLVLWFIIAVIVVIAIFIVIDRFRSCSSETNNNANESKPLIHRQPSPSGNPETPVDTEANISASGGLTSEIVGIPTSGEERPDKDNAVHAANSSAAGKLPSGTGSTPTSGEASSDKDNAVHAANSSAAGNLTSGNNNRKDTIRTTNGEEVVNCVE